GCVDPDGDTGPLAYCAECTSGTSRCMGGLEMCVMGRWSAAVDCTATPGFMCIDPDPLGGAAYCGLCLKGQMVCHGNNLDVCNPDGQAFSNVQMCTDGCNPNTLACCAAPNCGGDLCGSATNACGETIMCGSSCGSGFCCPGDTHAHCCGITSSCCG